jgi:hypothetical protein
MGTVGGSPDWQQFNTPLALGTSYTLQRHPAFDIPDHGDLAIVLCHFNPCNYRAPVRNLSRVLDHLLTFSIPVYATELRCGLSLNNAPILPGNHPHVLQLTSNSVLFQKENLLNLAVNTLPMSYAKILCMDADVLLVAPSCGSDLARLLDTCCLAQPYSRAIWTDYDGNFISDRLSTAYGAWSHQELAHDPRLFHPGLAVAARRELWSNCGGLYNGPLGNGDWMLWSAALDAADTLAESTVAVSEEYWHHYRNWADAFSRWVRDRIGYVSGDAIHLWHGSKKNREYVGRMSRLKGYDPIADITLNSGTGLPEWSPLAQRTKQAMISSVSEYFLTRLEDDC